MLLKERNGTYPTYLYLPNAYPKYEMEHLKIDE